MSLYVAHTEIRHIIGYFYSSVIVLNILVCFLVLTVDAIFIQAKRLYAQWIAKKLRKPKLSQPVMAKR
jgi:hypothetical protein